MSKKYYTCRTLPLNFGKSMFLNYINQKNSKNFKNRIKEIFNIIKNWFLSYIEKF